MNILSLGEKIKKLRKEKNMTLKELAGDRITAAQISHIERDKSHTSRELLEYLASQLDVSVDYLLETKEMQSKKLTDNLILQGEILIKCNDLEKAEDQLNEAIKICDEYKVLDNYATCNFLLADINFKKGKYSESVMGYEKALYYFIKNNDKDKLYKCYLNIGKIYMIEEFYKGAILQFEFSEGILNEIQVEDVDIYKDLYSKMAYCYIKLDNNEKSLDYINKMDEIDIKNNPEEELDVLILKANNFLNVGEFEKSKEYFKKALEILDKEKNKTENNEENSINDIQNNDENIGGAIEDIDLQIGETSEIEEIQKQNSEELNENIEKENNEVIELSQMEQDANFVKENISIIKPINGTISSRYGLRNPTTVTVPKNHTGIDLAETTGTKIVSATDGTVILNSSKGDYGNHLKIQNGDATFIYAHCSKLYVKVGQTVKAGDTIAAVGSTGNSTGNHLHFEIRLNDKQVNPQKYLYK